MNKPMKQMIPYLLAVLFSTCVHGPEKPETVWIDVRSETEYLHDHIDGDRNMPLQTLKPENLTSLFDTNTKINLYCRSGGRAARAKQIFEQAGFTNVSNVGGINDARDLRNLSATP